jgi:phosphate transport system substrate-binding protein
VNGRAERNRQGRGSRARAAAALLRLSVLLLFVAACGEPLATPEPIFLQATGSMDVAPLVAELAEAYGETSPLVTVEVDGLGTGFGLQALRAGEADMALASWLPPRAEEGGAGSWQLDPGWQATAVARDGLAIVVHPDNPAEGLGLLQLQDLFGGRAYEWAGESPAGSGLSALGEVQPVSREEGSGARAAFEALVMDGERVTPRAVLMLSPGDVVEYVASTPNAIGYVSMGQVTPKVKVLKIEGLLPTPETTAQGAYALTREFWLIAAEPVAGVVQDFVDFSLSPAGQQIVGRRYGRIR